MADSFFGFDTSLSNLNDDEGAIEPSEDEYDALNDETFGQDDEDYDWEMAHELGVEQLEISRRHNSSIDETANSQLEASLSQLVLDETDAPHGTLGSSVWRHDPSTFISAPTPAPTLKNVHTVEELERQLRQKQMPQQQTFTNQNYFQPRFPVILQRPPGLQAPVPLPFAPQQSMTHNLTQHNQTLNKIVGQNKHIIQNNQMGQTNQLVPNQLSQNVNQMAQNMNQFMQNNQMTNQFQNQLGQSNMNQMPQNMNTQQMAQNQLLQNQMGTNMSQMGQNINQLGQNFNQLGQNVNQLSQNINQLGQNVNQLNQNVNQVMPNGNQFGQNMNQFPHMMGQSRIIAPPPGLSMPRQNFAPNMGQYSSPVQPFRNQMPTKPNVEQQSTMNQQQNVFNQHMLQQQQQLKSPQMKLNVNQSSPSNVQNKNNVQNVQSTQNRGDSKVQKSRVYNNSSQKNMTSQNLVQLIQNTHPMLQFNNSFHNASHHPMLNNRSNVFNNNQFGNNQIFNNQRHNGQYNNNSRQLTNGDDSSVTSDTDEYAGMMTPREKQWLINIQILQLNTGTPYIHDFYYTVFLERQSRKEKENVKEAHKANQQNHPFYSAVKEERVQHGRERHNSTRHNSTSEDPVPRTYVPTQFENSLGKLQCGSVTAPRKIIDVEVVSGEPSSTRVSRAPSVASTTNPAEVPREMKRTKQILLDIEALYLILLRLEELNDPLAISNALILKEREEKQKQLEAAQKEALENEQDEDSNVFLRNIESVQRRPKQESPKTETVDKRQVVNLAVAQKPPVKNLLDEDKEDLINKMFIGLLHSDRLGQMLNVRKGKTLVCRFVARVPPSHARLRALWSRVLRALPSAARRDDGNLTPLSHHYNKYIQNTNGWSAILESCSLLAEALDPARTPYALTSSFTLSCVCALILKALSLVNTPEATSHERQWSKFLKTLARALKNTTLNVAKPVQTLPETKLLCHIKQLESRSTIEILQRGRTTAEFADLSKNDLSEQLVKHLC